MMKLLILTLAAATAFLVSCSNEIKADTNSQSGSVSKIKIKPELKKEEVIYPLEIKPLGFDRHAGYFKKKKDNC